MKYSAEAIEKKKQIVMELLREQTKLKVPASLTQMHVIAKMDHGFFAKIIKELGPSYEKKIETLKRKRRQHISTAKKTNRVNKNSVLDNDTPNLLLRRLWI